MIKILNYFYYKPLIIFGGITITTFNPVDFEPLSKASLKYHWFSDGLSADLLASLSVKVKQLSDHLTVFLYNYNDFVSVHRNHPLLVRCRGLVLDQEGTIVSYPFDRFFNDFEVEAPVSSFDWKSSSVLEKIDGTLICISFIQSYGWLVHTRGSFYPLPDNTGSQNFETLFKSLFSHFDTLNKNFTYMFELVTFTNRIVTFYDSEFVVLLGARNLNSFHELSQGELDDLVTNLAVDNPNIRRPRHFSASNLAMVKELFQYFKDDEEGLVIVDKYFTRLKIKQLSYFQLSKIKMLSDEDLFKFILGKTVIDPEIVQKMPETQDKINVMTQQWLSVKDQIFNDFNRYKHISNRKEFAMAISTKPYKSILFSLYDSKDILDKLSWSKVEHWLNVDLN